MATVTNTVEIMAGVDRVWGVLGDLTATRFWLPGVVAARMEGEVRICQMADGQEVHEAISELDAGKRSYRFRHLRVGLPVGESGGTFTVSPGSTAGTATVVLQTTFTPLDPSAVDQLTLVVHGAFQQSLESLRRYVEEGIAWTASP